MSANITAVLTQREAALTVPSEAIFAMGNQSFVYVVKADSTVAMTPVQTGTRTASLVEVTQGLTEGANVVTAGHQKLFDGAKVMAIPSGMMGGGGPPQAGQADKAKDGGGS
jgi:multidrug efflux pump subunit AcrA (membrane-fusion protein)